MPAPAFGTAQLQIPSLTLSHFVRSRFVRDDNSLTTLRAVADFFLTAHRLYAIIIVK